MFKFGVNEALVNLEPQSHQNLNQHRPPAFKKRYVKSPNPVEGD